VGKVSQTVSDQQESVSETCQEISTYLKAFWQVSTMVSKLTGSKISPMLRHDIEKQIVEASNQIIRTSPMECLPEEVVRKLLLYWHDLMKYYRENDDDDMNIEVIREYLRHVDIFWVMSNDQNVSPACRESLRESLDELQSYMEDIIEAVGRKL
jgi:hypothetical protein